MTNLDDIFGEVPRDPTPLDLTPDEPSLFPVWYRFDDTTSEAGEAVIYLRRFAVVAEKPKTVLICENPNSWWAHTKRVLKCEGYFRKRYAYPTKELAWKSYLIRKSKQLGYARAKLEHCLAVKGLIEKGIMDVGYVP